MTSSILVPLFPAVCLLLSALFTLYHWRHKFACLSRCHQRKPSYTEVPSEPLSRSPHNPAPTLHLHDTDTDTDAPHPQSQTWIDSLVETALHRVWTGHALDSLFARESNVLGTSLDGNSGVASGVNPPSSRTRPEADTRAEEAV